MVVVVVEFVFEIVEGKIEACWLQILARLNYDEHTAEVDTQVKIVTALDPAKCHDQWENLTKEPECIHSVAHRAREKRTKDQAELEIIEETCLQKLFIQRLSSGPTSSSRRSSSNSSSSCCCLTKIKVS